MGMTTSLRFLAVRNLLPDWPLVGESGHWVVVAVTP